MAYCASIGPRAAGHGSNDLQNGPSLSDDARAERQQRGGTEIDEETLKFIQIFQPGLLEETM